MREAAPLSSLEFIRHFVPVFPVDPVVLEIVFQSFRSTIIGFVDAEQIVFITLHDHAKEFCQQVVEMICFGEMFRRHGLSIAVELGRQVKVEIEPAAVMDGEEGEKGSLEKGKFADFVMLDKDLMKIPAGEVLQTRVMVTYLNGEKVYSRAN